MNRDTKVTFNKLEESAKIEPSQIVRVTKMNHIVEVMSLLREPDGLSQN